MLLERNDINPDNTDKSGRTPLSWAAENGSLGIGWMLLERNGINLNWVDENGRMPLSRAAMPGASLSTYPAYLSFILFLVSAVLLWLLCFYPRWGILTT